MAGYICQGGVVRPIKNIIAGMGGVTRAVPFVNGGVDSVVRNLFINEVPISAIKLKPNYSANISFWDPSSSSFSETINISDVFGSTDLGSVSNIYLSDNKIQVSLSPSSRTITSYVARNTRMFFYLYFDVVFEDGTSTDLSKYLYYTKKDFTLNFYGTFRDIVSTGFSNSGYSWGAFGKTLHSGTATTSSTYSYTITATTMSSSGTEYTAFLCSYDRGTDNNSTTKQATNIFRIDDFVIDGKTFTPSLVIT